MKTSELTGAQLDYWVAKAEGAHEKDGFWGIAYLDPSQPFLPLVSVELWSPSTNWEHGGPIIERNCIDIECAWNCGGYWDNGSDEPWRALAPCSLAEEPLSDGYGDTPLIAAMRAYVASKFGEEVGDTP